MLNLRFLRSSVYVHQLMSQESNMLLSFNRQYNFVSVGLKQAPIGQLLFIIQGSWHGCQVNKKEKRKKTGMRKKHKLQLLSESGTWGRLHIQRDSYSMNYCQHAGRRPPIVHVEIKQYHQYWSRIRNHNHLHRTNGLISATKSFSTDMIRTLGEWDEGRGKPSGSG